MGCFMLHISHTMFYLPALYNFFCFCRCSYYANFTTVDLKKGLLLLPMYLVRLLCTFYNCYTADSHNLDYICVPDVFAFKCSNLS